MPPPSGVLHGTIIDQFIACGNSRDIAHELASQIWLAVLDNLEENHHTFLLLKRLALEGDVFLPYPYSRSIKVQWRVFEKLFTDFRDCFNHSDYYDLLAMAKNKFQPIPSAWYVSERSPSWFSTLKEFFETTPSAAVGEIGLDKGSRGREIDFNDQIEVFRQQLELAKELKKPASIHCVRAFGYVMPMKAQKAKKMLKAIPSERILLESDAPDALPNSELSSLFLVDEDPSLPREFFSQGRNSASNVDNQSGASSDASTLPKEMLNHPANIDNLQLQADECKFFRFGRMTLCIGRLMWRIGRMMWRCERIRFMWVSKRLGLGSAKLMRDERSDLVLQRETLSDLLEEDYTCKMAQIREIEDL
ncbi:TatD family [Corchorus olitorius]|uniref:TatD family n=1 Tax=Corchorus olitorius TaxID=93759 RepID=A0A1R3H5C3_9ROSI|nr:TatD family [Corchorus olitorius]